METAEIDAAIEELEIRLERLRALYEQYFMGIEKLQPTVPRKDVDRRIWELRRCQIRNTAKRFKLQTIIQRYNTFQQYWQRICRDIENGTYKRHLLRAESTQGASSALTAAARKRLGLGRTWQSLELFDDLTVRENLLSACEPRDAWGYVTGLVWPGKPQLAPQAIAALHDFGLAADLDRLPTELSYGPRRLLGVARSVSALLRGIVALEPCRRLETLEQQEAPGIDRLPRPQAGRKAGPGAVVAKRGPDPQLPLLLGSFDPLAVEPEPAADPAQLASLLESEHPQPAAAIISQLDPERAARTLENMPEALLPAVLSRLGSMTEVPAGLLEEAAAALSAELPAAGLLEDAFVLALARRAAA